MSNPCVWAVAGIFLVVLGGCDDVLSPRPAPLFDVPLAVDGQSVGKAIIDTGGDYEILLREDFGLTVVDVVEVRVFGGREWVAFTEGFAYRVGGLYAETEGAIVGVSSCDCNGVGVDFFRKTGVVLGLSFLEPAATFVFSAPQEGVVIDFEPPPEQFADFDTSFIEVDVTANDVSRKVLGLLDTGAGLTVMRRGLVETPTPPWQSHPRVTIGNAALGTVSVSVGLFDTDGLPDIIIGTDAMQAWGDRWYFSFAPEGGAVTVVRQDDIQVVGPQAALRQWRPGD